MADTTFVRGTEITSDWLNGVNDYIYTTLPSSSGSSGIGYLPSGTGAIALTTQTRLRKSVYADEYPVLSLFVVRLVVVVIVPAVIFVVFATVPVGKVAAKNPVGCV